MARQRRAWESLSPAYRARLSRNGISKRDYERGRNLSAARGHYATPEHGLKSVNPKNVHKYGDYIRKKTVPKGGGGKLPQTPEDEARELNEWKDRAFAHMKNELQGLPRYFEPTVESNVYGGITRESGLVRGMNLSECKWTVQASRDELRAHAYPQYHGNPWWYH